MLPFQEYTAGLLRFTLEDRAGDGSGGPAIRVFGPTADGQENRQLLRFDCFRIEPHYHFDPDGRDEKIDLEGEDGDHSLTWSLAQLRTRLPDMVRHAGGSEGAVEAARSSEAGNAVAALAATLGQ